MAASRALAHRQVGEAEGDVVEHVQVGEQGIILKHEPDTTALGRYRSGGVRHHGIANQNASGLQGLEPGGDPQQRRLAAARGANQADQLARRHRKADVVNCIQPAITVAYVFKGQSAHGSSPAATGPGGPILTLGSPSVR